MDERDINGEAWGDGKKTAKTSPKHTNKEKKKEILTKKWNHILQKSDEEFWTTLSFHCSSESEIQDMYWK